MYGCVCVRVRFCFGAGPGKMCWLGGGLGGGMALHNSLGFGVFVHTLDGKFKFSVLGRRINHARLSSRYLFRLWARVLAVFGGALLFVSRFAYTLRSLTDARDYR